ncbi:MAG: sigma-70 family RNA polymerase sigma factor [Chitinophagaceae bacterium]|nr:sigma-70 family RNA polymerase sigma factor [Chitinophagaceae bacterium]
MDIVKAIRAGNDAAYKAVFDEYYRKLYFYIFSKTRSAWLSEETVQLTFIKLWDYRDKLSLEHSISTQLFRIASTTLIDLLRKQHNLQQVMHNISGEQEHNNHVYHHLDAADVSKKLFYALESMPPARRKVFELSRFEGLSYKQIAKQLSISPKTVENHMVLAIKHLKRMMLPLLFWGGAFVLCYENIFTVLGQDMFRNVFFILYNC